MKQIKTLLIAALFIFRASQTTSAQAKQLVDVSEIMAKMPAMLDAQKQLEKIKRNL
jgi:outer membrane protein